MDTKITFPANVLAKISALKARDAEKSALKLELANKLQALVQEASKNGCTLSEINYIVILAGSAAQKFAEDLSCNGSEVLETAAERAENFKLHTNDLMQQIAAMRLAVNLCGQDADTKKFSLDSLLSFEFERNQKSFASLFDWWWQESDYGKIEVVNTICKRFNCLKIGRARNLPKFDQTLIDAGVV